MGVRIVRTLLFAFHLRWLTVLFYYLLPFNLLLILFFNQRPNGIRFIASAGTTEFAKRWDPKPGDIVSFKHHGFLANSKKPKFPTLYRMRQDLTWEDVVNNWKEQKFTPTGKILCFMIVPPNPNSFLFIILCFLIYLFSFPFTTIALPLRTSTKYKPKGYWARFENRRGFLIEFAKERGFDPFTPENWKDVGRIDLEEKEVQSNRISC